MSTHVLTLAAAVPPATVFNFLADIENLPAWTGGFCEWLELRREGWLAYTALGELTVETKVDDIARTIDLCLRQENGWSVVIPLRVRSDGETGTLVTVVCRQPPAMSAADYEQLFDSLLTGLRRLPGRLCAGLAAA